MNKYKHWKRKTHAIIASLNFIHYIILLSFRSKEEVEKEFQEYKTAAEHEQGEVETLGTELADLKEQHRYEKEQLKMQV